MIFMLTKRPKMIALMLLSSVSIASFYSDDAAAQTRDQIRVVGSSTVFPFTSVAAEQFGKSGKFKTPIVESTGTGGGFKLFCSGVGIDTPDINNASRAIVDDEKETCKKNGVTSINEIAIGYDGIVIARKKQEGTLNISKKDLFLALARQVPKDGKLVNNPYLRWKEVNPSLPDQPIQVYGPPPTSGTRDAFVEMAIESSCKDLPEFKAAYADAKERDKACKVLREDGKYIEAGEDDNLIIQKLKLDATALGIMGYGYVEENRASVQAATVDAIIPTLDTISNGTYKLSRKLFIYIKGDHLGKIPGLKEFAQEITSDAAIGPDGYVVAKGLVPLKDADRAKERERAVGLK